MRSLSCGERDILNQDADDDWADPYPKPIRVSDHTARKAHPCDACNYGSILVGERYTQLVYLDHDDGDRGFKIERHCRLPGCQRSEECLDWMLKEEREASDEYYRTRDEENL